MMDLSLFQKLSLNGIALKQLFINDISVWKSGYKNWVRYATESDGVTIYNGGKGYKDGYRVRSGGAEAENAYSTVTGFIPFKKEDVLRLYPKFVDSNTDNAVNFYDADFNHLGQVTHSGNRYGFCADKTEWLKANIFSESDGITVLDISDVNNGDDICYIRITNRINTESHASPVASGAEMIITVNEEIPMDSIVRYTNQIPIAIDSTGAVYNGKGYKDDVRVNSSHVDATATGWDSTGYIPVRIGDIIRFKNCTVYDADGSNGTNRMHFNFFDESFNFVVISSSYNPSSPPSDAWAPVHDSNGDLIQVTIPTSYSSSIRYMRITMDDINDNSIITINEEID